MREDPARYWSKALGFGFTGPVTADLIGEVCDFYRARDDSSAVLQLAPSVLPPGWEKICADHGLYRGTSSVKLARDLSLSVPAASAGPPVERVDARSAEEWATMLMRGFDMAEKPLVAMTAAFAARPDVRAYVVRYGGEVVAAAGMYIGGETAQLLGAATLPPYRGRGAQSAMLRMRISDAIAALLPGDLHRDRGRGTGYAQLVPAQHEEGGVRTPVRARQLGSEHAVLDREIGRSAPGSGLAPRGCRASLMPAAHRWIPVAELVNRPRMSTSPHSGRKLVEWPARDRHGRRPRPRGSGR